jgi:hypothetical protein
MRLRVTQARASDELLSMAAVGMEAADEVWSTYKSARVAGTFGPNLVDDYIASASPWLNETARALDELFPTSFERRAFLSMPGPAALPVGENIRISSFVGALRERARYLERLRVEVLPTYTDAPLSALIYVEQIDSFARVGDVNPREVVSLTPDGFLDLNEDRVQLHLERILDEPFHKVDWAGERLDLYSSNLRLFGRRASAAFLLKGPGIGRHEMSLDDLGKRADQLQRLFDVPADIYVVQSVGPISETVIKDLKDRVDLARSRGNKDVVGCPITGVDTARVFRAYGLI